MGRRMVVLMLTVKQGMNLQQYSASFYISGVYLVYDRDYLAFLDLSSAMTSSESTADCQAAWNPWIAALLAMLVR